jgi:hypothetical protein
MAARVGSIDVVRQGERSPAFPQRPDGKTVDGLVGIVLILVGLGLPGGGVVSLSM